MGIGQWLLLAIPDGSLFLSRSLGVPQFDN